MVLLARMRIITPVANMVCDRAYGRQVVTVIASNDDAGNTVSLSSRSLTRRHLLQHHLRAPIGLPLITPLVPRVYGLLPAGCALPYPATAQHAL